MAGAIGTLAIRLAADVEKFKKDLESANGKLAAVGKRAESVAKKSAAAFVGFSGAIAGVTVAAGKQLQAEAQLANAFRASGKSFDLDRYKELATSLQQTTLYGDEVTIAMGSMLARFGLTQSQLESLTPGIQDMATAMGVDLNTAAMAVGKAMSGSVGALSRYGISLSDAEKNVIKFGDAEQRAAVLSDALAERVGGAAAAATQTASGAFQQLQNALGDIAEDMGKVLDKPLSEKIHKIREAFESMPGPVKTASAVFLAVGAGIAGLVTKFGLVIAFAPKIISSMKAVGAVFKTTVLPSLLPILGILAAIAAAIAGVILIVGAFKQAWDANLFGIKDTVIGVAETISDAWVKTIDFFVGAWTKAVDLVVSAWGKVKGFLTGAKVVVPPVTGPKTAGVGGLDLSTVQDVILTSFDGLKKSWSSGTTMFKGLISSIGDAIGFNKDASKAQEEHTEKTIKATETIADFGAQLGETTDAVAVAVEDTSSTAVHEEIRGGAGEAAKMFGDSMTGAMGEAGSVINSAVEGFATAGPFGAIAAVVGNLISRSKAFGETSDGANAVLGELVDAFEPLAEAMKPMAAVTHQVISIIADILKPVFEAIGPVFVFLGEALRAITIAILYVIRGIGMVWNGIVGAISGFLRMIADIEVFGRRPFGALDDWADTVDRANVSLNDLDGKINDLRNATIPDAADAIDDGRDGIDDLADSAEKATEEILNAPQGFKIAAARFGATIGEPLANTFGAVTPFAGALAGGGTAPINVGQVVVQANDPVELARELQRIQEYEDYRLTGSMTASAATPVRGSAR